MAKIIAANWKMNKIRSEAEETAKVLGQAIRDKKVPADRTIMVFPPYLSLPTVSSALEGCGNTLVGAQNFYPEKSGAFTGEISLPMLQDAGVDWVLVGHSERRHVLMESDAFIARKTQYALEHGFGVVLCIGETLEERDGGKLNEVLSRQLSTALDPLTVDEAVLEKKLLIAYEPVWAMGTGKVAGEKEVLEAHALVKKLLGKRSSLPVLYGGSVKPTNAGALLALDNVDGLLVGGASLAADSFLAIINA